MGRQIMQISKCFTVDRHDIFNREDVDGNRKK
jgi:hypothetical protein